MMLTQLKSRLKNPDFTSKLVLATFALSLAAVIGSRLWTLPDSSERQVAKAQNKSTEMSSWQTSGKARQADVESALSILYPANDPYFDSNKNEPFPFAGIIRKVSKKTQIEPALILAVVKTESNFKTHAVSHSGAVGLMQVIADQAGRDVWKHVFNETGTPSRKSLKDPYTNLLFGTTYLQLLRDQHFSDVEDEALREGLVLAAYNWGVGNVKKMLTQGYPKTLDELTWSLWQRAPKETYSYVKKVMHRKARFQTQYEI